MSSAQSQIISIHPPARGGTTSAHYLLSRSGFQSTHPQGVGRAPDFPRITIFLISIHPPARGGTYSGSAALTAEPPEFQSTHPQGVGLPRAAISRWLVHFNPPTRKGWDIVPNPARLVNQNFNPPTRKGWDSKSSQNKLRILYKINKNSVAIQLVSNSFQFLFSNCLLFSAFFRCEPCVLFLLTPPSHC